MNSGGLEKIPFEQIRANAVGQIIRKIFTFETSAGVFRIAQVHGGWGIWFEDQRLMGRYPSPQTALDDLASGSTDWPSCGDPSKLGIDDNIDQWESSMSTYDLES